MYPRSGVRSGGTCERTRVPRFVPGGTSECTLVLVFVPGEHPPKPPIWKTTLLSTPDTDNPEKMVVTGSAITAEIVTGFPYLNPCEKVLLAQCFLFVLLLHQRNLG